MLPDEARSLSQRERSFLNELILGTVRWISLLEWLVERRLDKKKKRSFMDFKSFILVGAYQLLFLHGIPDHAAINETVEAVKKSGLYGCVGIVNAILRRIAREREEIMNREIPSLPLHLRHAHPSWMVSRWLDRLGPMATEALLNANNERPPLTLRVNPMKIKRDEFLKLLRKEGIEARPGRFSPEAVIIHRRMPPRLITGIEQGLFYVQDEAFQSVTHLLDVRPGERVLDACAGVGGKSTHIVQLMRGKGELWAFEPNAQRRKLLLENLNVHAGGAPMKIVVPEEGDVLRGVKRGSIGYFDRILVDAPCSGLGVIRRHPDIKWNRRIEAIEKLAEMQLELVETVSRVLKPGGRLVYATCTNEPEETDDVVRAILSRNCGLVPVTMDDLGPLEELRKEKKVEGEQANQGHCLSGRPPETDGFFAAVFTLGTR